MSALSAAGQAICDLTLVDLPEIHGVRLGAARPDFELVFAGLTSSPQNTVRNAKPDLTHVEEIWTGFYRERLASVEFDYDRTTEWKNVRQFAEHLERKMKLPFDSWVFVGETEAKMDCNGFKAAISSVRNTFSLTDTIAKSAAERVKHLKMDLNK